VIITAAILRYVKGVANVGSYEAELKFIPDQRGEEISRET
jgi:hypothetical protein